MRTNLGYADSQLAWLVHGLDVVGHLDINRRRVSSIHAGQHACVNEQSYFNGDVYCVVVGCEVYRA